MFVFASLLKATPFNSVVLFIFFATMALLSDLINLNLSDVTEKIIAEYIWSVLFANLCFLEEQLIFYVFGVSLKVPRCFLCKYRVFHWWLCFTLVIASIGSVFCVCSFFRTHDRLFAWWENWRSERKIDLLNLGFYVVLALRSWKRWFNWAK